MAGARPVSGLRSLSPAQCHQQCQGPEAWRATSQLWQEDLVLGYPLSPPEASSESLPWHRSCLESPGQEARDWLEAELGQRYLEAASGL